MTWLARVHQIFPLCICLCCYCPNILFNPKLKRCIGLSYPFDSCSIWLWLPCVRDQQTKQALRKLLPNNILGWSSRVTRNPKPGKPEQILGPETRKENPAGFGFWKNHVFYWYLGQIGHFLVYFLSPLCCSICSPSHWCANAAETYWILPQFPPRGSFILFYPWNSLKMPKTTLFEGFSNPKPEPEPG